MFDARALAPLLVWVLTFSLDAHAAAPELEHAPGELIHLKLRMDLVSKAGLALQEVKLATFPGGKRCAFTYAGPTQPRTIAFFTKLGFRTTIYVGDQNPAADLIRSLEDAGAEIGTGRGRYWGAKPTISQPIGHNTFQEAYDVVTTSRLELQRLCKRPVICAEIGGRGGLEGVIGFLLERSNVDNGKGFGGVFQDSNYLLQRSIYKPHVIYLGRGRKEPLITREKNSDFDAGAAAAVPNEKVYWQALAHQFLGTLRRIEPGQIVRFGMRDFQDDDLARVERIMGEYGRHPLIWHATEGQIGAYEYLCKKISITAIRAINDTELELDLALERDAFQPYLLAPLCIKLPKSLPLKSACLGGVPCPVTVVGTGTKESGENEAEEEEEAQKHSAEGIYVDVPLQAALTAGCQMTLTTSAPNMTIPGEMPVTLSIRNTLSKPLENVRVQWLPDGGVTVRAADGTVQAERFELQAGEERIVRATVRTQKEARFGLMPLQSLVTATVNGEERVFMAGFEIVAAPRFRVDMLPQGSLPMPKGRSQAFFVFLANGKSSQPGGPPDKLIHHLAGPCKGRVRFDLPEGMTAEPQEQSFELAADDAKTLLFMIRNDQWAATPARIRPVVILDGEKEPLEVPLSRTPVPVIRSEVLAYKPLDEQGLLAYMSFDKDSGTVFDRSVGGRGSESAGAPSVLASDGVKGWCSSAAMGCMVDSFKNIDHAEGTMMFWMRRDPQVKNENQFRADPAKTRLVGASGWNNDGECIVGWNKFAQVRPGAESGIGLRRYPGWDGKGGYLQATYQGMCNQLHCVQVPYENARQWDWRHVAVLWSTKNRRLEIYLDGKLAGKAEPGETEWHSTPWDHGGPTVASLQPISCDHGKWTGTSRDELYIYNRALTESEIKANMDKCKK